MNTTTQSNSLLRASSAVTRTLFSLAAVLAIALPTEAAVIRLENGNSVAQFRTENEAPFPGLHEWSVDGVDHVFQQWFYYRLGDAGGEATINSLAHLESTPIDLTGDGNRDFLRTRYADPLGRFAVTVDYLLTGGTPGSNQSGLLESIQIQNTGASPLPMHFFQFADFDLNNTSADDAVVITGTPPNTAHQTDPVMRVSETVSTPPPSHYEVNDILLTNDLVDRLNDDDSPTTLADIAGPLVGDAAWAFQWEFDIPVGESRIITKVKSIRVGEHIPEPGSIALVLVTAATGALVPRLRRR
jgi:hypothetical protein